MREQEGADCEGDVKTDVVARVAAGQAADAADGVKRPIDDGRGAEGEQESCVHATVLCAHIDGGESASPGDP